MKHNSYKLLLVKISTDYILIDTGFSTKYNDLEKELETAGFKLGYLRLIIIIYIHIGHNGNTTYLREKHYAKIAMYMRARTRQDQTGKK
ncbi:hypothetical protein ACFL0D_05200 [Thermoproteota archaeon]